MSLRPLPPGLFQKRAQSAPVPTPQPAEDAPIEEPAAPTPVAVQPELAGEDSGRSHHKSKKKKSREDKKHKKKEKKRKDKKSKHTHSSSSRKRDHSPPREETAGEGKQQFAVWSLRQKCWITAPAERNAKGQVDWNLTQNYFPRMEGIECANINAGDILELRDYWNPDTKRYEQLDLSRYNVVDDPNWDINPEVLEARDAHASMLAETDEEDYHPQQGSVEELIASLRQPTANFHDKRHCWRIELAVYTAKKTGKKYVRISRIIARPKKLQNLEKQQARQRAIDKELHDLVTIY